MALRFIDSFDHYATADRLEKWTTSVSGPIITSSAARHNQCLEISDIDRLAMTLDSQATWIVGLAFNTGATPVTSARAFLQFLDNTTVHVDLRLRTDLRLEVTRNGTALGVGSAVLSQNTYYYLELKTTISDTVGVAHLKVNGVDDVNLTSQDTRNGASASANVIMLGQSAGGSGMFWRGDDLYICDGTGSAPTNNFLGDCRVESLLPNGNGNTSNFDGSDGNSTDNYLLVDEATPDDDTTYVQSPDVGDKDTYAYGNLVTTAGTVYGVQILPHMRKTEAGFRTVVGVARLAGTEVDGSALSLADSYLYYRDIRETKPGGGGWTVSDVNSAEFGIKVNS